MTGKGDRGCSGDPSSRNVTLAKTSSPFADSLALLQEALADTPVQALPAFVAELERLKAQAWSKLSPPRTDKSGRSIAVPDGARGSSVDQDSELEYLSIRDLARRIGYEEGTIRNLMSCGVFKLGEHYVKPRGRILFKWPAIQCWLETTGSRS